MRRKKTEDEIVKYIIGAIPKDMYDAYILINVKEDSNIIVEEQDMAMFLDHGFKSFIGRSITDFFERIDQTMYGWDEIVNQIDEQDTPFQMRFQFSSNPLKTESFFNLYVNQLHDGIYVALIKEVSQFVQKDIDQYEDIQRTAGIGHWAYDESSRKIRLSSMGVKIMCMDNTRQGIDIDLFLDRFLDSDRSLFIKWLEIYGITMQTPTSYETSIFRILDHQGIVKYIYFKSENKQEKSSHGTVMDITENYITKQRLVNDKLRNAIGAKAAKMAFFEYDCDNITQSVDDYWYEMVGLDIKYDNIYPYYMENIHPDDLADIEKIYKSPTLNIAQKCEFRFYNRKKQDYMWLRQTTMLIEQDNNPGHFTMMGAYQNVNAEKRNQEKVDQLANMLEIGMQNGNVDIWDYNLITDTVTLRSSNIETYGLKSNTTIFKIEELSMRVHPDDLHYFKANIRRMWIASEADFRINFRIMMPDVKHVRWLKITGKVTEQDALGRASRCIGISQDITERFVAEEKLRKNEEKLRQASHIAHLGSWEYSSETKMIEILEGVHEILGISRYEDRYMLSIHDFISFAILDDQKKLEAIFDPTHNWLQFDEHFFAEVNKQIKKLHIIATYKYDRTGKLVNIIGTIQDISELNILEQALRQAEKMTAVGQLAGGIAHDFNNILMATSGYTELIMLKTQNEEISNYCKKIMSSIERSTDLTRKLLAFSRKDSLIKKPIHLNASIENALGIISRTIDKNIELQVDIMSLDPFIFADATEIQNVFINLCLNARDAMPFGGRLSITSEILQIDYDNHIINGFELVVGKYVKVAVSDTGFGIEPQNLKKIFDPFFTTKEVGKGTGLGLSASFGTIMSHGGAIDVESIVNVGTKFYIYFPVYEYGEHL